MARAGLTVKKAEMGGDSCEVGQDRVVIGLGGRSNRDNKRLKIEADTAGRVKLQVRRNKMNCLEMQASGWLRRLSRIEGWERIDVEIAGDT